MDAVFIKILNMSITASWLVLAVLLLRLILKKAPKWVNCLLWAMVAVRLICPFSFESVLSLIPSAETVPQTIVYEATPAIRSGVTQIDRIINSTIMADLIPQTGASVNPIQIRLFVWEILWGIGIAVMVIYASVSYFRLRKRVSASIRVTQNMFLCDYIASPFILGIAKPKIYLPSAVDSHTAEHVIAHEKAHIQRRDHWWKPLGFALLTLHWFNPFLWLAYILLCRDIELACDEKVIRELGAGEKKHYSEALLSCSVPRHMVTACPLAFGEVGVRERVKRVLRYQKPAFWIILAAIVVCLAVAVCFLTDPAGTTLAEFQNISDAHYTAVTVTAGDETVELQEEVDVERVKEFLESARFLPEPVSQDRSEDRPRDYGITLPDINTSFWLDSGFSQMWVEDSVKPSLTYRMKNPEQVREFFEALLGHDIPEATITGRENDSLNATNVDINGRQLLVASTENAGSTAWTTPNSPTSNYQGKDGWWLSAGEEAYRFAFFLPTNWEYKALEGSEETFVGIAIRPSDQQEGQLMIQYSPMFAVCGTELTTGEIVLSQYHGSVGTYYGSEVFDYIVIHGKTVHYTVINNQAGLWWDAYETEAMEILNTLILSDCHASEEEVIANAEAMAEYLNYETVEAEYDADQALWLVRFWRDGGETLVTTIRMDSAGNYIDTIRE